MTNDQLSRNKMVPAAWTEEKAVASIRSLLVVEGRKIELLAKKAVESLLLESGNINNVTTEGQDDLAVSVSEAISNLLAKYPSDTTKKK